MLHFRNNKLNNILQIKYNNKNKGDFTFLLGKKYSEATKLYNNLRVVKLDDKSKIITMDYCKERCNIVVKKDVIIGIDGFY
jgi:hypothetical protein